ncbi:type II toxin-antitoxin system VapB family antitoxin [Streptomyces sp. MS19]|uniref:type II toxin-antitoxin system VapB family antitoxin n=1 Tax=Streptomyces sp. MS19 TaxID=3385972 RepID=UPI0039A16431
MPRIVIDLDDWIIDEAMRLYGTRSRTAAVRAAVEDAVRRRLRREFADAVKSGELDFSEIIENTGPLGTRPRDDAGDAS